MGAEQQGIGRLSAQRREQILRVLLGPQINDLGTGFIKQLRECTRGMFVHIAGRHQQAHALDALLKGSIAEHRTMLGNDVLRQRKHIGNRRLELRYITRKQGFKALRAEFLQQIEQLQRVADIRTRLAEAD